MTNEYKSKSQTLHYYIFSTFYNILQPNFTISKFRKLFPDVLRLFSNLKVCLIGEWSSGVTRNFWRGGARLKIFRQVGVVIREWPRRKRPNLFTNLDNNKSYLSVLYT